MEKSHLECPGCVGTNFHQHEITIADPQNEVEATTSSAYVICSDCQVVVGVLLPPYLPPKHFQLVTVPVVQAPYQEGAYGEGSC